MLPSFARTIAPRVSSRWVDADGEDAARGECERGEHDHELRELETEAADGRRVHRASSLWVNFHSDPTDCRKTLRRTLSAPHSRAPFVPGSRAAWERPGPPIEGPHANCAAPRPPIPPDRLPFAAHRPIQMKSAGVVALALLESANAFQAPALGCLLGVEGLHVLGGRHRRAPPPASTTRSASSARATCSATVRAQFRRLAPGLRAAPAPDFARPPPSALVRAQRSWRPSTPARSASSTSS